MTEPTEDDNYTPWLVFSKTEALLVGLLLVIVFVVVFFLGHIGAYNRGWNACADKNNYIIEEKP